MANRVMSGWSAGDLLVAPMEADRDGCRYGSLPNGVLTLEGFAHAAAAMKPGKFYLCSSAKRLLHEACADLLFDGGLARPFEQHAIRCPQSGQS